MSVRSSREIYKCKKCNLVKRGHVCKIYDEQKEEKIVNNRKNVKQFYKKLVIDNGLNKPNEFSIETSKDNSGGGSVDNKHKILSLLQKRIEKRIKNVEGDTDETRDNRRKKDKKYSSKRLEEWERNDSLKGYKEEEYNIIEKELCLELGEWNEMEKYDEKQISTNDDLCLKLGDCNVVKGKSEQEFSGNIDHMKKENNENEFQGIDELIDDTAIHMDLKWYEDLV